jgi:hypothetical protein
MIQNWSTAAIVACISAFENTLVHGLPPLAVHAVSKLPGTSACIRAFSRTSAEVRAARAVEFWSISV